MITVEYAHNGKHYTDLVVSGHAEYAEHGHDIVCSAVTALLFGVKNTIEYQSTTKGHAKSGSFNLVISTPTSVTDIIIDGFFDTITQINKKYPNRIEIQEDEE